MYVVYMSNDINIKKLFHKLKVMEAGQAIECGHPYELLQLEGGHFRNMVKNLGTASEYELRNLAKRAYSEHFARTEKDLKSL